MRTEKNIPVPKYLIHEWLNGEPIYYKGYEAVIKGELTFDEIKAYGNLQILLLNILKDFLQPNFGKEYLLLIGEAGLNIGDDDCIMLDFAILPKAKLSFKNSTNQFLNFPPTVVFQIDSKSEAESYSKGDYYDAKAKKLLAFGVAEVCWIYTETKTITYFSNEGNNTLTWDDRIEVLGHSFSIDQSIQASEQE